MQSDISAVATTSRQKQVLNFCCFLVYSPRVCESALSSISLCITGHATSTTLQWIEMFKQKMSGSSG